MSIASDAGAMAVCKDVLRKIEELRSKDLDSEQIIERLEAFVEEIYDVANSGWY